MILEPENMAWRVNCDGQHQLIDNHYCESKSNNKEHGINTIADKYFKFSKLNIQYNKLVLNNFESTLKSNYDLLIKGDECVHPKVVLDYEYNDPYIPNITLEDIRKLKFKCKSASEPISGAINDIDVDKTWFNRDKIIHFNNIKIMPHKNTMPTLLHDNMTANGKTCAVLFTRFAPTKLVEFARRFGFI